MFGCLGRLGCLALLALAAVAAWLTYDRWRPLLFGERPAAVATWEPVGTAAAERAERTVGSLARSSSRGYVTLTAAELASLLAARAGAALPASVDSVQAAIEGERVMLRARIDLEDLSGLDALGPLASMLNRRERFETAGRLSMVRPGLAQYVVESAQIGDLPIPQSALPALVRRLTGGARPDSLAPAGLPIELPEEVGQLRVEDGRVILYRRVP